MDKLLTEREVETKVNVAQTEKKDEAKEVVVNSAPPENESYISSFASLTVADVKREEEKQKAQEAEKERLRLLEEEILQEQRHAEESDNLTLSETREPVENANDETITGGVIEKPNYDLIEENTKVIKLKNNAPSKKKRSKKLAGIALACALGGAAIVCVTNCVIIDQMNSNFIQIDESYKFNLASYLKDIYNLDTTKKSMEMIETYPEDLLEAGDVGQKSNWFDRLCGFLGGIFGG